MKIPSIVLLVLASYAAGIVAPVAINRYWPTAWPPQPEKPAQPLELKDFHREFNEYHDLKWKLEGVASEVIDLKVEVAELKRANTNLLEQSTRAISGAYQAVQATYVHDDVLNGLNWRLLKLEPKPGMGPQ